MSLTLSVTKQFNIAGQSLRQSSSHVADGNLIQKKTVAPGEAGTLSTRTDDDTGEMTASDSSHGFEVADRVDCYWSGGCRRGMAVTAVVGEDVEFDGGSGNVLPIADTAITLVKPTVLDMAVAGSDVVGIIAQSQAYGQVVFANSSNTEHLAVELAAGYTYDWLNDGKTDNPVTGDQIDKVFVSHGGTSNADITVALMYNN